MAGRRVYLEVESHRSVIDLRNRRQYTPPHTGPRFRIAVENRVVQRVFNTVSQKTDDDGTDFGARGRGRCQQTCAAPSAVLSVPAVSMLFDNGRTGREAAAVTEAGGVSGRVAVNKSVVVRERTTLDGEHGLKETSKKTNEIRVQRNGSSTGAGPA